MLCLPLSRRERNKLSPHNRSHTHTHTHTHVHVYCPGYPDGPGADEASIDGYLEALATLLESGEAVDPQVRQKVAAHSFAVRLQPPIRGSRDVILLSVYILSVWQGLRMDSFDRTGWFLAQTRHAHMLIHIALDGFLR